MLNSKRDIYYSLINPIEILETYLSLTPHSFLHPNCEKTKNLKSIPIKLVLTEILQNSLDMNLISSLSGVVSGVPFKEFDKKYASFKCALIIGPWYLEYTETGLCVPKRITEEMNALYDRIVPFSICDLKLNVIASKISKVICEWNSKYSYVADGYSDKKKQGNCFSFVEKILQTLNIKMKFNGSLANFMREMKEYGDAGPSIYPGSNSSEFEKKFNFSNLKEINDHMVYDDIIGEIFEIDPNFDKNYPHDFLVIQAIDASFWIRFIFTNKEMFEPLMEHKVCLCSCHKNQIFKKIPVEFWKEVEAPIKKRKKTLLRRNSVKSIFIKSAHDLTKRKILRLEFSNSKDQESFKQFCEEREMEDYYMYYDMYIKYIEEEDLTKKYTIGKKIYKTFIKKGSELEIEMPDKIQAKIIKFCETDSTRGFQIVYKEVCLLLQPAYEDFIKLKLKQKSITKENKIEFEGVPKTFNQLIQTKNEFQLFTKFVSNSFGRDYIDCFNDILEFEKNFDLNLLTNIEKIYCERYGKHCVISDPILFESLRNNFNLETLKEYLHNILNVEFYQRFIHSRLWKDYVHTATFTPSQKNSSFENAYKIVSQEEVSFSKIQLMMVTHRLTGEIFRAKKKFGSKNNLANLSIKVSIHSLKVISF
jgi:hypothetical protein